MNRKEFLKTSAGLLALAVAPGIFSVAGFSPSRATKYRFRSLRGENIQVPVTQVTPSDGLYQQTYFDVCPWSPSERYMVVSKFPFQHRMPVVGDVAEVCVIDLYEESIRTVYRTRSWGLQTGTNAQWGASDRHVFCNDIIDGRAVCVRIDLDTGETTAFAGPMYSVAPDESCVVGFPLELFDVTQLGYGCPPKVPGVFKTLPSGASDTEGIWRTDLKTNEKTLIVSLADAAALLPPPPYERYTFYFWHSKFNRQGTRIYQVLRCLDDTGSDGQRNPVNLTFRPDGSELYYTTPDYPVWGAGGGHPNWHADGEHLVRHLKFEDGKNYFVQFRYDGTGFRKLSDKILGGGHPSVEIRSRYLITDVARKTTKGRTIGVRLVDLQAEEEMRLCTLGTIHWEMVGDDPVFRLDGHPVWSRDYKKVSFQAAPDGNRQLFVIDLTDTI